MKSKKILLGSLSTMALVATPIAAVVSCDNGKTTEAGKASIVKATAADFKITKDGKAYFVSKDDAAKAGSLVIGAETFTWDAALTTSTVKLKNDADKSDVTVTVAKATAADFGLKLVSGENKYFDAAGLKKELKAILGTESGAKTKLGITLKFENKKLAADSLTALNTFLKSAALEAKDVKTDDAGVITLTLDAVTTAKPVVKDTAAADLKAVNDAKTAFDALAITGAGTTATVASSTAGPVIANPTLTNLVPSSITGITLTAGHGPWVAPANGVAIKFKSVATIATGGNTGNIVFELTKGAAKADVTIVITIS